MTGNLFRKCWCFPRCSKNPTLLQPGAVGCFGASSDQECERAGQARPESGAGWPTVAGSAVVGFSRFGKLQGGNVRDVESAFEEFTLEDGSNKETPGTTVVFFIFPSTNCSKPDHELRGARGWFRPSFSVASILDDFVRID